MTLETNPAGRPPALELRDVRVDFPQGPDGQMTVIDNLCFKVAPGEFVSILGPSGCGKSTTLRLISDLQAPTEGEVLVDGRAVQGTPVSVGMMFQPDTLLPWLNVYRNVELGLKLGGGPAGSSREARIRELIKLIQLDGFESSYPHQLSGGMKKRVALAQLLAYDPSTFLMDEPFGALDAQTKISIETEFLNIWQELKKTVLFITHDVEEAIALSDRVLVMSRRPGVIKKEFVIDIPRPRDFYEVRFTDAFRDTQDQVWHSLREEF